MTNLRENIQIFGVGFIVAALVWGAIFVLSAKAEEKPTNPPETIDELTRRLTVIKDKKPGSGEELALRLEIFKKIIEFSITEASELRVQLLLLDYNNKREIEWKGEILKNLDEALEHYNDQRNILKEEGLKSNPNIESTIILAQEFKNWRSGNYLPLSDEANNFIFIKRAEKIQETTVSRLQKITRDVDLLSAARIKSEKQLKAKLGEAGMLIKSSAELYNQAVTMFWAEKELVENERGGEEDEEEELSASEKKIEDEGKIKDGEIIEEAAEEDIILNIKDLIRESLEKARDAYWVFMEMGGLVRESLR